MRRIVVVMIAAIVLSSGAFTYTEVSYDTDRHAVYNDEAGYRTIIVTEQEKGVRTYSWTPKGVKDVYQRATRTSIKRV